MQRIDLIEKRRFVGREFLLLLWMESELFEATLRTQEHGEFGLWLEKKLMLSAGSESTRITAPMPGLGREAKEALLRGQLPEGAGIRIAWKDDETSLVLKAESFAISTLKLTSVLDKSAGEGLPTGDLVDEMLGKTKGRPKKKKADEEEDEETPFYERMTLTKELEGLLETLYRDFLHLRLSPRWDALVVPTAKRWASGKAVDADAYRAERTKKGLKPGKQLSMEKEDAPKKARARA
jgi:hypothetical protein